MHGTSQAVAKCWDEDKSEYIVYVLLTRRKQRAVHEDCQGLFQQLFQDAQASLDNSNAQLFAFYVTTAKALCA